MRSVILFAVLFLTACSGDDDGVPDAGMGVDADFVDAPGMDTPGADAGTDAFGVEAPGVDAPLGVDAAVPGCTPTFEAGTSDQSAAAVDGDFVLHMPIGGAGLMPLIIDLHGFTGSPSRQDGRSDMRAKADLEGFVLVQPQGNGASWNAGACCGTSRRDDVAFVRAIVEEITVGACVDRSRVYATGMSNGGFLAHRIGCEAADLVAAIAPVAGVLGIDEEECTPSRSMPVMHFHGTSDLIVPYNGNRLLGYPSADETVAFWVGANTCTGESMVSYDEGDTTCDTWNTCAGGTEVTLCTVERGGHSWPDGGGSIDATDAMWDFFTRFTL